MTFEELGIIVKTGRTRYSTICPKCNDNRTHHKGAQCLTVNNEPGNRFFKCHHCNWQGNIDAMDKYKKVQEKAKIPSSQKMFSAKVREYITNKRGISINTAKELKLYEGTAFDRPQICFPFFMHLTLVNVKYLNMEWKKGDNYSKWTQLPKDLGTRIIPFGIHRIKTHDDQGNKIPNNICIITEGEWDCLTWIECGYSNTISVPQGAPSLNAKNFDKEFAYMEDPYVKSILENIDLFIISGDGDDAGKNLTNHLAMILGKEKCRIVQYPVGYKDINQVFVGDKEKNLPALGKPGVVSCYENVTPLPIKGVIKASAVYDDLMKIRKGGFESGLGCGIPEVDWLFTMKRKLMMFVSGIPGCFGADQLIHTIKGTQKISEIKEGDYVLCHNHKKNQAEFRTVLKTHIYTKTSDKLFKITLKDGTIIKVTENHEFFNGVRYVKIKDIIISLNKKIL